MTEDCTTVWCQMYFFDTCHLLMQLVLCVLFSYISLFWAYREVQGVPDTVPEGGVVPPPLDSAWAESTRKKALLKLEKLDTDLKNYKGNSIKESIRYDGLLSSCRDKRIELPETVPKPLKLSIKNRWCAQMVYLPPCCLPLTSLLFCPPSPGEAMMTWGTITWTAATSAMPSSATPEPETIAPVLSMSLTCVWMSSRYSKMETQSFLQCSELVSFWCEYIPFTPFTSDCTVCACV